MIIIFINYFGWWLGTVCAPPVLLLFAGARSQLVVARWRHRPRGRCAATPGAASHALKLLYIHSLKTKIKSMTMEPNSSKRKIKLKRDIEFDYDNSLNFLATDNRSGNTTLHHVSPNSTLTPPNIDIDANPGHA